MKCSAGVAPTLSRFGNKKDKWKSSAPETVMQRMRRSAGGMRLKAMPLSGFHVKRESALASKITKMLNEDIMGKGES
jgi:hypothetical protein